MSADFHEPTAPRDRSEGLWAGRRRQGANRDASSACLREPAGADPGHDPRRALPARRGAAGRWREVVERAAAEAAVYRDAGVDALLVENMHDVPT